jgi:hypothetical protein
MSNVLHETTQPTRNTVAKKARPFPLHQLHLRIMVQATGSPVVLCRVPGQEHGGEGTRRQSAWQRPYEYVRTSHASHTFTHKHTQTHTHTHTPSHTHTITRASSPQKGNNPRTAMSTIKIPCSMRPRTIISTDGSLGQYLDERLTDDHVGRKTPWLCHGVHDKSRSHVGHDSTVTKSQQQSNR